MASPQSASGPAASSLSSAQTSEKGIVVSGQDSLTEGVHFFRRLPTVLPEPLYFLDSCQREILQKLRNPSALLPFESCLPCWVPWKSVALACGFDDRGIEKARKWLARSTYLTHDAKGRTQSNENEPFLGQEGADSKQLVPVGADPARSASTNGVFEGAENFVWATEFENVHQLWSGFREPILSFGRRSYKIADLPQEPCEDAYSV